MDDYEELKRIVIDHIITSYCDECRSKILAQLCTSLEDDNKDLIDIIIEKILQVDYTYDISEGCIKMTVQCSTCGNPNKVVVLDHSVLAFTDDYSIDS